MNEQKSAKQLADEEYAQRRDPAKFNRSLFRQEFLKENQALNEDSLTDYHNAHKPAETPAKAPEEITVDAPLPTWTVTILSSEEHRHVMTLPASTKQEAMRIAFQRSGLTKIMNITAKRI